MARSATAQDALATLIREVRETAQSADAVSIRAALSDALASSKPSAAWADGLDVPGTAYERLVSNAHRRPVGQFATPFWAADVMARWLLTEPTRILLDPGVGSGRLLFRALRGAQHRPNRLVGLDVDPLAVQMADFNLRVRRSARHDVRIANFLLDDLHVTADAISCNPPYSRHHAIEAAAKRSIHAGFEDRLGLRLSRLAGLHVLFLVRAIEVAAPDARIAFITPSGWLDIGYGDTVKRWVLERCRVEGLVQLNDDGLLFGRNVLTTTTITLLRKGAGEATTRLVCPAPEALPDPSDVVAAARGEPSSLDAREIALTANRMWSRRTRRPRAGTRLDAVARIRRGIATGANRFFVLSEADRLALKLPREVLRPCAVGPRMFPGLSLTTAMLDAMPDSQPRWLLDCRDPNAEQAGTPLARYLRRGRRAGVAKGYLASRRRPWYRLEQRNDAAILFTYFNRTQPRFVRNAAGAVPLNTWLVISPQEGVSADALFDALNDPSVLRQMHALRRSYGGGMWKLEPGELGAVRVRGIFPIER